jgi:hypothetical protein
MDDRALFDQWTAGDRADREAVRKTLDTVLAADRMAQKRGRLARVSVTTLAALLFVALLWCAAHGVTPVVRGGYALMAAGLAMLLFAEYAYASWEWGRRPGPQDSMSQIRTSIALLTRQAHLMRSAAVWCGPIFIGAALVAWWIYAERSRTTAVGVWVSVAFGWAMGAAAGRYRARELDARRSRLEQVHTDLARP